MRKNKYIIFTIMILFLNISYVYAECTTEEMTNLKKEANKIRATYKHLGKVETEWGEIFYNNFNLEFTNVPNDFYLKIEGLDEEYKPENNIVKMTINNGKWNFDIYSSKCAEKVDSLLVKIPRYNVYSEDPLCEGIDGDKFSLCGKYYESDVTYESFKERVENYRAIHKIDSKKDKQEVIENKKNINLDIIIKYINKYKTYILGSIISILLIVIITIIIKKKRSRGVLK